MPSYTRQQLSEGITASADISSDINCTLVNNASSVSYFNIEGVNGKTLFSTHSITNPVNCSFVSESNHISFICLHNGLHNRSISEFDVISGSLTPNIIQRDYLLNSITGEVSASGNELTTVGLSGSLVFIEGDDGAYSDITASNANLTASFAYVDATLYVVSIEGDNSSLNIGDNITFYGTDNSNNVTASFILTEGALSYLNVSASDANVTASIHLRDSSTLGSIRVTEYSGDFKTGDTITFPSQSLGATTADGSDLVFTLQSTDIVTNGTASFTLQRTGTLLKEDIRFRASNAQVYSVADPTSSGSYFGVDLSY